MNADIVIHFRNGVFQLAPCQVPPAMLLIGLELIRDEVKSKFIRPVPDQAIEQPSPEQAQALLAAKPKLTIAG